MSDTDTGVRTLTAGTYDTRLACPQCGAMVSIPAELDVAFTRHGSGVAHLRPALSTKRIEHSCGGDEDQDILPFAEDANGEAGDW